MANTRELVKRRKAIRNIRKITRTMELIATSRFKKAMDRATQAEPFTRKIAELAADLTANAGAIRHPLLEVRETTKNSVLLVLCSNRGLCGGYNGSILREAGQGFRKLKADGVNVAVEVSGKRAINWCKFNGITTDRTYTHFEDKPKFEEVNELAERFIAGYVSGKIDRVDVAYTRFLNAARQQAVLETILPFSGPAKTEKAPTGPKVEYEFLPDAAGILEEIVPVSFKARLFKCFLDAAVSEQIARRVAMKAATDNADEIIRSLSQEYNRARQSKITTELSEIIAGAAALE
ncbi:MAG: ATP synthase F1 subunit gamma [Gemmataceae bacterium]|nr:ATP synthase F1 subunit gamma [Gemmataceae bacterium]